MSIFIALSSCSLRRTDGNDCDGGIRERERGIKRGRKRKGVCECESRRACGIELWDWDHAGVNNQVSGQRLASETAAAARQALENSLDNACC